MGASTHPGTGVPIVLAGAKITSTQILQDLRMEIPWEGRGMGTGEVRDRGVRQGKEMSELDRVRNGEGWVKDLGIWILALLVLLGTMAYVKSGIVVKWEPEEKAVWGSGRI